MDASSELNLDRPPDPEPGEADLPTVSILGVPVHAVTMAATLALVERFMAGSRLHQIATVNPEFVMTAQAEVARRQFGWPVIKLYRGGWPLRRGRQM